MKLEPTNAALLDAYACLLAELEDDGAAAALQQAVAAAPHSGHEKYMYLAQVRGRGEAAAASGRGRLLLLLLYVRPPHHPPGCPGCLPTAVLPRSSRATATRPCSSAPQGCRCCGRGCRQRRRPRRWGQGRQVGRAPGHAACSAPQRARALVHMHPTHAVPLAPYEDTHAPHTTRPAAHGRAGARASGGDDDEVDEVAALTAALASALCSHAEMILQRAVAERDAAGVGVRRVCAACCATEHAA